MGSSIITLTLALAGVHGKGKTDTCVCAGAHRSSALPEGELEPRSVRSVRGSSDKLCGASDVRVRPDPSAAAAFAHAGAVTLMLALSATLHRTRVVLLVGEDVRTVVSTLT